MIDCDKCAESKQAYDDDRNDMETKTWFEFICSAIEHVIN